MQNVLLAFLIAFVVTLAVTPLMRWLALRSGIIDKPGHRKVHRAPIPYLGGVAIFAGFAVAAILVVPGSRPLNGLLFGAACILILGLLDDILDIPAKVKLGGQVLVALVFALTSPGNTIDFFTNPFSGEMLSIGWLNIPLTVFWIVAVINAVNLIDGMDGLAAGISFIAAVVLMFFAREQMYGAAAVIISAALAGSCLGFLQFNFHPAKIFMGDAGSMLLGFVLAAVSVQGTMKSAAAISLLVPFLALMLPIFDTASAIVRRALRRQPVFKADREHIHHRLLAIGLSHRQAVLVMYLVGALVGGFALLLPTTNALLSYALSILLLLLLAVVMRRLGILVVGLEQEEEKKRSAQDTE